VGRLSHTARAVGGERKGWSVPGAVWRDPLLGLDL